MKPAPFRYLAPKTEDELLSALSEHEGNAQIIAGGQSLVPMMNFRLAAPGILIDINGLSSLAGVRFSNNALDAGSLVRHAVFEDDEAVRTRFPLIFDAMLNLAHRAVRNRGTIGGSLALAYPNAQWPLLTVTLGAHIQLKSPRGTRRVEAQDFIAGPLTTALASGEFVQSVHIPIPPAGAGSAYTQVSRRHGDFALASAAAVIELDGSGRVRSARAGLSGGQGVPIRVRHAEDALLGELPSPKTIDDIAQSACAALAVDGDSSTPAGYRRMLLCAMLQRAIRTSLDRAVRPNVR